MADALFGDLEAFYGACAQDFGADFLHPVEIYRPFWSLEEQNEWMGKSAEPHYAPYIRRVHQHSRDQALGDPYGGVSLQRSGYVDIPLFLDAAAAYFASFGALRQSAFQLDQVREEAGSVWYEGVKARGLVLCTGLGAHQASRYAVPGFAPVKGEILDLRQQPTLPYIVNRGVFRISLGEDRVRVGSTYTHFDLDEGPTERAKKELLEKLEKLVQGPVDELLAHRYGLRPATKDRKPILGKHPESSGVYILNGLGAKGVSLAPYFSEVLMDFMLEGKEVPKEVNINRFFKYI
ncbi:FAD dependent oxidoreductase [Nitritalea halalkaliphila LW7]|uniref:FAD dependent oxidoreductase n=1 Tax=Nitritalea halalkaliphila LW7 TaxID=1189621 RepID=I5C9K3_9BACT|nr:FAD dependent oxidoreductase [Nitritalea halalkaliphila LW7]